MKNDVDSRGQLQKVHRRNRMPLSCEPCRVRKQKCNRKQPCQNCIAHEQQPACHFRAAKNGRGGANVPPDRGESQDVVRNRIERLESLVQTLVEERDQVITPESTGRTESHNAANEQHDAVKPGQTVIQGDRSVYVGGDDWRLVLDEINELKRSWTQEHQQLDEVNDELFNHPDISDGSSLLLNQVKPLDRFEIVATLPSKATMDKLIARFFDRETFPITIPPILHETTFMREYEDRWKDLSEANFIWLALLFSILGVVMLAFHLHGEPPEYEGLAESLFQLYRTRTAQCLLSGDISKCSPYTLEALRLNATAELNRKDDNRRGLWMMTGLVVRAAVNMGYHRDPEKVNGISPLQAEYRRRVWLSIITMDTMASFLAGLPRMTASIHSDNKEPLNVHESELSEGMTCLPPSRPLEHDTPATYLIVKGRLFHALGRIADFHSSFATSSYGQVLDIDRALSDTLTSFPQQMKVSPGDIRNAPLKRPDLLSSLNMTLMYHRGMCMLHSRFQAKAAADRRFQLSRDRCVSSALEIVGFQGEIWPAAYQFSLTRQLLILAAMVLLLELELLRAAASSSSSAAYKGGMVLTQSEAFLAMERSCRLWEAAVAVYGEAAKVLRFLESKLASFRAMEDGHVQSSSSETLSETPAMIPLFNLQGNDQGRQLDFGDQMTSMEIDPSWPMWDSFVKDVDFGFGMA